MALVPGQQADEADTLVGQSREAHALVAEAGLEGEPVEMLLLTPGGGADDVRRDAFETDADRSAAALAERMARLAEVDTVQEPVWSPDRDTLLLPVVMAGDVDRAEAGLAAVEEARDEVAGEHPGVRVEQTGGASLDRDIWERVGEDLLSAEAI